MKKALYILAGIVALALGALGSVVPILPTVPFLLVALYCFANGSDRLHEWFKGTELYKKYLDEYVREKALTLKQKLTIQLLTGIMLAFPFVLLDGWVPKVIVVLAFLTQSYFFIFKIKTLKPGKYDKSEEPTDRDQNGN